MTAQQSTNKKVAVIGAGSVGAAISYSLVVSGVCSELLLVDIDKQRVEGEVKDLSDGAYLTNVNVKQGTSQEAGQCDVIVVSAGAKQREGESRDQLIGRNYQILKSVIGELKPIKSSACIVVVANPNDVLTFFAQQLSGLPHSQVFGSGTFLDTARLRVNIATELNVSYTSVHAYVMGEHGDSQFVPWSIAQVGGTPLSKFDKFRNENFLKKLAEDTKNKAYEIIKQKGATYWGIGTCVSSIVQSIMLNNKNVRPLSTYLTEYDCCMSVPVVLGSNGIVQVLPLALSDSELAQLQRCAEKIKQTAQPMLSQLKSDTQ